MREEMIVLMPLRAVSDSDVYGWGESWSLPYPVLMPLRAVSDSDHQTECLYFFRAKS